MDVRYWEGIGRRKTSTARVRIYEIKDDNKPRYIVIVNDKDIREFFDKLTVDYILDPLRKVGVFGKFRITVKVKGGGRTGWKDAIRLGLSRALVKYDESFKPPLRKAGYLTRDPRAVERKKVGLKKARKAPRFSKR